MSEGDEFRKTLENAADLEARRRLTDEEREALGRYHAAKDMQERGDVPPDMAMNVIEWLKGADMARAKYDIFYAEEKKKLTSRFS